MNLFYNVLLVTCVFATTQHVAFSVQAQDSQPPKILMITLSPPGPIQVGTEVNATARISSSLEEPICLWMVFGDEKKVLKGELTDMTEKEYESMVSLGPITRYSDVFLDVRNSYGKETKHIQFDFAAKFGERCKTSEQCLLVTNNSECNQEKCLLVTNDTDDTECDPQKKRCFCEPGYGIDEEDRPTKTCKEYPIRKVKTLTIGKDSIDMDCRIYVANFSEINWFRNDTICTYGSPCSQDEKTVYHNEISSYQRRLWLQNVITSNTYMYTCQATTKDGRNWTVVETTITVVPDFERTSYLATGSNYSVLCGLQWSSLEIRLVRDGKDFCTPNVTWCLKHNSTKGSSQWYDVLNLRANHTFTCEAITGEEKPAIVSVYHFIIGEIPKILEVTFSPPGTVPKGTEVIATARIHSPSGKPNHRWKFGIEQHRLEENLTLVSENTYESRVALGPINTFNSISLEVSNSFGRDKKDTNVIVAVEYGDWCDERTVCATNNTECNRSWRESCSCRQRHVWDYEKKICREYAELRTPCEISQQCQSVTFNSECDQEKKRCFCAMWHGIDYEEDDKKCKQYPFRKKMLVEFEKDVNLNCQVFVSNLSEIHWYRNGQDLCTPNANWCVQAETINYDEKGFFYSRNLTLLSVISNDTYTCQAIANKGKWDVSATQIVVVPNEERTTHQTFGEDRNISCSVTTPNLQVRLVRDGIESCTPGATWCSQDDTWAIQKSTSIFTVFNQRANSTYTCEAYSGDGKLATMQVYHLVIDPRPKILVLTHSPVQKNTEVVATARFFSPGGKPYCYWALNNYNRNLNCNLSVLAENIYGSKFSLGTIDRSGELLLYVRNTHGEDIEKIQVEPSGGAVQKGGISMIALTILITLFRTTTFTAC